MLVRAAAAGSVRVAGAVLSVGWQRASVHFDSDMRHLGHL